MALTGYYLPAEPIRREDGRLTGGEAALFVVDSGLRPSPRSTRAGADGAPGRERHSGPFGTGRWLMRHLVRALGAGALALGAMLAGAGSADAAEGQLTIGAHITVAPRWLDPGETESAISPFMVLYAIHDALVKPTQIRFRMHRFEEHLRQHTIQIDKTLAVIAPPTEAHRLVRNIYNALADVESATGPAEDLRADATNVIAERASAIVKIVSLPRDQQS